MTFRLWEVSGVILFQNLFVITFLSSVCTFYIFFLRFRLGLIVKLILEKPDLIYYFILSYNIHFLLCYITVKPSCCHYKVIPRQILSLLSYYETKKKKKNHCITNEYNITQL